VIGVQTVLQVGPSPSPLVRQQHRIPAGVTIRTLLRQAGLQEVIGRVEVGTVGLARHGRRAWLDDVLLDGDRVELVEPINADAKAARAERVATDRSRRTSARSR
jgi:putative ubiquitin-RnfH superfamily antitoxin RatB of RatAB toxin-antitoxin module